MHASATPVSLAPTSERIEALDTLRGVAVFGILLANVLVFFGLFMLPSDRAAALPTARADAVVAFVEKVLVDGKFYSIFSLLFGIGFGLQLARGGETAVPRFNRRLRILLAIGAIHAFLIWAGDILMLYALLGFPLPWFARKTSRELLRSVVILLAIPTALYVVALVLWVVRAGIAHAPPNQRAALARWSLLGLGLGLPLNIFAAWALHRWPYLPPSLGGLLGVVMQAAGVPLLAVGYASTVALLVVNGRRLISLFAPVGRMALTNYLMHSVICVILSYGFGFGLWWRIGASTALAIAVAIIVAQIPLSSWWLSRYRFGPVEWIWRRLTYGRPLALRAG